MSKKNLILGGILVFLVLFAYLSNGPLEKWREDKGKPANFLSEVKVGDIDRIEIEKNGEKIAFLKKNENDNEKWLIEGTKGFYLNDEMRNGIIDAINEAKGSEIEMVSENATKKDEFSVGEKSGTKVALKKGEELLIDFVVGKMSSDFSSTYLARLGDNKTYAVKGVTLSSAFTRGGWYDKTIFSTEMDKIDKIRFQYPAREFTVEKKTVDEGEGTTEWVGTLPYSFRVGEEKIADIVEVMSDLSAIEVPAQTFDGTGLEKHSIIIQATGDGIDNTLMVGDANENDLYFAKKGDSDNIYLISKETRDLLDKKIWEMR